MGGVGGPIVPPQLPGENRRCDENETVEREERCGRGIAGGAGVAGRYLERGRRIPRNPRPGSELGRDDSADHGGPVKDGPRATRADGENPDEAPERGIDGRYGDR